MREKINWHEPTCQICFERGHEAKSCTEDKHDFELVGPMAAFIGARLNYILPPCNSSKRGDKLISTIRVDQHKEKFWFIRVYCQLADENLVTAKWLAEREREADGEEPPKEFREKCLRRDAMHYRQVHLDMMRLTPVRLHKRIRSCADYRELLFDTVQEMEKKLDELEAEDTEHKGVDNLEYYRKRWNVESNLELKQVLARFYEKPSLRDMISD